MHKQLLSLALPLFLHHAASAQIAPAPPTPLLAAAPGSPIPLAARGMAAGDINRDGSADLVLIQENRLLIHFGGRQRRWGSGPDATIQLPGNGSEILLADLNHDQNLDLILADHDSYDVFVMLGSGDGRFRSAPASPFAARKGTEPHTHGLAVADLNRDGHPDLVTANNDDGDLSVLLGDGKGAFAPAPNSPFPCGPSPYPFALADINGDKNLDALVPNSKPDLRSLTILLGNGTGQLLPAPGSPLHCDSTVRWVACGDLNADGLPDVVASHDDTPPQQGKTLAIWLNARNGNLERSTHSPLPLGHFSWSVEIIDMNRDGKPDLVVGANDAICIFLGDGKGALTPAPGSPFKTGKGAWRATVADFNGDGKPDLATRCIDTGHLELLYGN